MCGGVYETFHILHLQNETTHEEEEEEKTTKCNRFDCNFVDLWANLSLCVDVWNSDFPYKPIGLRLF